MAFSRWTGLSDDRGGLDRSARSVRRLGCDDSEGGCRQI